MRYPRISIFLFLLNLIVLTGCSSTTLSGSWRSPDFSGKVDKIYIVGVSKQDTHRRIFEDEFGRKLRQHGIQSVSSYKDLQKVKDADMQTVLEKVSANGADALLMTRIIDKRTEEVVNPGRVSGYQTSDPYGRYGSYSPRSHYYHYRDYFDRRYELTYEPATITQFKVITLESNLYDAQSGDLIWSAQLETVMQGSIQTMIEDYIEVVTRDLLDKGVI